MEKFIKNSQTYETKLHEICALQDVDALGELRDDIDALSFIDSKGFNLLDYWLTKHTKTLALLNIDFLVALLDYAPHLSKEINLGNYYRLFIEALDEKELYSCNKYIFSIFCPEENLFDNLSRKIAVFEKINSIIKPSPSLSLQQFQSINIENQTQILILKEMIQKIIPSDYNSNLYINLINKLSGIQEIDLFESSNIRNYSINFTIFTGKTGKSSIKASQLKNSFLMTDKDYSLYTQELISNLWTDVYCLPNYDNIFQIGSQIEFVLFKQFPFLKQVTRKLDLEKKIPNSNHILNIKNLKI